MIVGKGYAKTDTEVSMKMRGELFEVTPPHIQPLDLSCSGVHPVSTPRQAGIPSQCAPCDSTRYEQSASFTFRMRVALSGLIIWKLCAGCLGSAVCGLRRELRKCASDTHHQTPALKPVDPSMTACELDMEGLTSADVKPPELALMSASDHICK